MRRRATATSLLALAAAAALTLLTLLLPREAPPLTLADFNGDQLRPTPTRAEMAPPDGKSSKQYGRAWFDWVRMRDPRSGEIPRAIISRGQAFARTLPTRATAGKGARTVATQEWSARGPINVGGRTRALAVDVTAPQRLFAGGVTGGLWLSEDGADTWQRVTSLAEQPAVSCIDQDQRPGQEDTWYYGTGEYTGSGSRDINSRRPRYTGDGIYKSTDGGITWNQLASTASTVESFTTPFDVVWRVRTNPANESEDEVWAATFGTIHRSLDGGTSWELMLGTFQPDVHPAWTDVAVSDSGTVYATIASGSADGGIWRYDDGAWENITPPGFPTNYNRVVIGIAPSDENHLYFLGETPGAGLDNHSLWYLNRNPWIGQDIWSNRSANMPNETGSPLSFGSRINSQGGYNLVVAVHPADPNVVYIGGTSLFRSDNAFSSTAQTWWIGGYNYYYGTYPVEDPYNISYPYHHADCHNIAFEPGNPTVVYSSHDGGLSRSDSSLYVPGSDDPFPWEYIEGYITTQFYWVGVDPTGTLDDLILGGMQDNGTKASTGPAFEDPWNNVLGGDGMACDVGEGGQPGTVALYASTQYGGNFMRIELDDQGEFLGYEFISPPGSYSRWITPFAVSPADHRAFYILDTDELAVSSDRGIIGSWSSVDGTRLEDWWATALGVSTTPADVVYVGYASPQAGAATSRVLRVENAQDGIPSVTELGSDLFHEGWIHCITVDPADADKAILVYTNFNTRSLLYTEDGGATWRDIGGNLEENPDGTGAGPGCYWVEIMEIDGGRFYLVGTTAGLYSTTSLDDPVTWVREGEETIGTVWVTHLDGRDSDGLLAVGTHGYGTFSAYATLNSVGGAGSPAAPDRFALQPVYPNPFNATATATVRLPQRGRVRVELINRLGRRVATLADGVMEAGYHRIPISGDGLAAGLYFVRASTDGAPPRVRKAVYVK